MEARREAGSVPWSENTNCLWESKAIVCQSPFTLESPFTTRKNLQEERERGEKKKKKTNHTQLSFWVSVFSLSLFL